MITAVLGPTNTGKTFLAIETMLSYNSGMIGFPLRLLAREVYDKVIKKCNPSNVALITGEEKIIPAGSKYFLCTVESMPIDKQLEFVAIDEIQMCNDHERGHIFTDRLLNLRGEKQTMFMGSHTMKDILSNLNEEIEFINKERYSKLSYIGHKKISRIERKSAIIAFSTEEVYAIAELLRRQKGGCAIVMGSLSPKTRNSQVSLYQSGDVDYLVATDAIGMGINMDINNIYFSNLKKFDGKKLRRLNLSEIGQIAGRAGRYMNDGNFGVTGEVQSINIDDIELIENHKFETINNIFWRNSELNFSNSKNLINSLDDKPKKDWLRFVVTARAKSKIKSSLKSEKKETAKNGKEIAERKLRHLKVALDRKTETELIKFFNVQTSLDLYYKFGVGAIINSQIKEFVKAKNSGWYGSLKQRIYKSSKSIYSNKTKNKIIVFGEEEEVFNYKLANCCNPIDGDLIFGFTTVEDGIKIHKLDCPNSIQLRSKYAYRILKAKWINKDQIDFIATLNITGIDRLGLINSVTKIISSQMNVNMRAINIDSKDGIFEGDITLFVHNVNVLNSLTKKLRNVDGVTKINRTYKHL